MLGGFMDEHRPLIDEGPYRAFEQMLESVLGEKVRESDGWARSLYAALCNVDWRGPNGEEVGYSWRAAGDVVAALRREGDYCNWYCGGNEGRVDERIATALRSEGWTVSEAAA